MKDYFPFIFIGIICLQITLLIIIPRAIIRSALRNHIVPFLSEKGLVFIRYKCIGFLHTGDFDFYEETKFRPFKYNHNIYLDIFYNNRGQERRITAKIELGYFSIKKVTYSRIPRLRSV